MAEPVRLGLAVGWVGLEPTANPDKSGTEVERSKVANIRVQSRSDGEALQKTPAGVLNEGIGKAIKEATGRPSWICARPAQRAGHGEAIKEAVGGWCLVAGVMRACATSRRWRSHQRSGSRGLSEERATPPVGCQWDSILKGSQHHVHVAESPLSSHFRNQATRTFHPSSCEDPPA